jgi:hypothetical protein
MTKHNARQYVEHWERVGPLLDEIRRDELRRFSHAEQATAIDQLLAAGLIHSQARLSSGLVDMQQILSKARHERIV